MQCLPNRDYIVLRVHGNIVCELLGTGEDDTCIRPESWHTVFAYGEMSSGIP